MKKIIMLLTVMALLATSVIGVSAVDYTADAEGKYTGVTHSGLTANEYYGVVVVKGTTATTVDFSNLDNILYIDQVTADENGAITIPAFMTKGDELLEGTIFIGGEGLPTATNIGYLKLAQVTPETFVISGTVSGYIGTTLPVVKVTDGTNEYTATYAEGTANFTVEVPVLESGSYTLTATKAGHLKYTKNAIAAEATVAPALKTGDLNADDIANVSDIALVVDNYNAEKAVEGSGYTAAYDVNEDNIMNVSDIASVVDNYNAEAIVE